MNVIVTLKRKKEVRHTEKKFLKIEKKLKFFILNPKWIILFCGILLLINYIFSIIPQDLKIYFVDVGQGDCCFITTKSRKNILVDTGGSNDYNVGKNVLVPYLLDRKVKKLDYVFISHFDTDHCNGLIEVMQYIPIYNLVITKQAYMSEEYKNIIEIANKKQIHIIICKTGDVIQIDNNYKIEILYVNNNSNDLNNGSMVCKFINQDFSMLFTGDIEKQTEAEIIELYKDTEKLKSNILKVAHHGSRTSSTQEFLNLVKPQIALIGVGKNNTFGHPNIEVLERLKNMEIKVYRTDKMGEIVFNINTRGEISITKNLD